MLHGATTIAEIIVSAVATMTAAVLEEEATRLTATAATITSLQVEQPTLLTFNKFLTIILFPDFERNWNSGGNNNSYSSFGGGGSSSNLKSNFNSFDRDFDKGFNSFSNNSNSGSTNGNFSNDRYLNNGCGNSNNGNGSGGGQYAVHLRGMPYDCGESDVQDFFAPLEVVNVEILYNNNGKR